MPFQRDMTSGVASPADLPLISTPAAPLIHPRLTSNKHVPMFSSPNRAFRETERGSSLMFFAPAARLGFMPFLPSGCGFKWCHLYSCQECHCSCHLQSLGKQPFHSNSYGLQWTRSWGFHTRSGAACHPLGNSRVLTHSYCLLRFCLLML